MKRLRAYPRQSTRRLSPKRKRGAFSTAPISGSTKFHIFMEWDTGKMNAIVDRDKDPCWAEPVAMMFNKLMYGSPSKSND